MNVKKIVLALFIAIAGGAVAMVTNRYFSKPTQVIIQQPTNSPTALTRLGSGSAGLSDFTVAAENSLSGVVHVKTRAARQQQRPMTLFDFFYGNPYQQQQPQQQAPITGSGSGVIVSQDGYIVTNNHVIDGASEIEVTLHDNRTLKAKLIGTDPTTDIALLKVEEDKLPTIPWGDSDAIKVGEWVLAVGNPFNLTSTVTAGIVSAKGRSINIIDKRMAIESFIQTDAAVNPGNSGGALVNTRGELVGINTAIASRDGSFTGYSFAVPTGIVQKVVKDIMEYGKVQRAILGVSIATMTSELAEKLDIEMVEGVLVADLASNGAAALAGVEQNDVILSVDGKRVKKSNELQEQIGRHRPGDKVKLGINHKGSEKEFEITLQNTYGSTSLVKNEATAVLGAELAPVSDQDKNNLRIGNGMQIVSLGKGKFAAAGIREGFIIVEMNNILIESIDDIERAIKKSQGGVMVKGIYPNGAIKYYAFGLD